MKELLFIFAAAAGKAELVSALLKIKMDEQDFANILKAAHAGLLPLAKLVAKTKTKVDDTAVSIPLEAIEEVAKFKGIEL